MWRLFYLLNIFFSRRDLDVLLSALISVKLGNGFFFKRLPLTGIVKSTPVAALFLNIEMNFFYQND